MLIGAGTIPMKPVEPGCEERAARVETTAGGREADPAPRACSSVLQRSTRSTRYSAATSGLSAAQPGELNFEQGPQRSSRTDAWLAWDSVRDMVFTAISCTGKCTRSLEGGASPTGRVRGGSSWLDGGCGQGLRRCIDDRGRLRIGLFGCSSCGV